MNAEKFQYGSEYRKSQLRGILSDCINVYKLILSSGAMLPNNENLIRDEVAKYIQDDEYKNENTSSIKNFQVDTEAREGVYGRTDIRFVPVSPYEGQKIYFTIECKRLDGSKHLNKEYVFNGINRFKNPEKYSTPLGYNAMIGFIVKKVNVESVHEDINSHLTSEEYLSVLPFDHTQGCYTFESNHKSQKDIVLLHLWLDLSKAVNGNLN